MTQQWLVCGDKVIKRVEIKEIWKVAAEPKPLPREKPLHGGRTVNQVGPQWAKWNPFTTVTLGIQSAKDMEFT